MRGHQPPPREVDEIGVCAHYSHSVKCSVVAAANRGKERKVRAVVAATRVAKMAIIQGCHPRHFFYFSYVFIKSIGTCMQNFKKIDRKSNHTFFI